MLPFVTSGLKELKVHPGDRLYVPGIRDLLQSDGEELEAVLIQGKAHTALTLRLPKLTREERDIILAGCLINYYAKP
ncbi:hypothetical protein SDC9_201294 [bioreactor metagenome]|uniref:Uncharacterized protein n=1 Tax=bioreactor metagenome TaxID=1076179 RepID=A0A645IRR4_9ZZZZ